MDLKVPPPRSQRRSVSEDSGCGGKGVRLRLEDERDVL